MKKISKISLCAVIAAACLTVTASAATHTQRIYYNQQGSTSAWKYASSAGNKGYNAKNDSSSDNILCVKLEYKASKGDWFSSSYFNEKLKPGSTYSPRKTFSKGYFRVVLNPQGACASQCVGEATLIY